LGGLCSRQRKNNKNNKLNQLKINKLELIDEWYWVKNEFWNNMYEEVMNYVDKNNVLPTQNA